MLSKLIITHCSPVLAGLKQANLFNYFTNEQDKVKSEIRELNAELNAFDIYIDILKQNDKSILIYIYRKEQLSASLNKEMIQNFLKDYGYNNFELDNCISILKSRIADSPCFPHEIGIFLGYPFEDVVGFIENKGLNFKLCGHWKVYCNEEYAKNCFMKYKSCTNDYLEKFTAGKSILDIIKINPKIS